MESSTAATTPTIGRIVHYYGHGDPPRPRAAIVTFIGPDNGVGLTVLGHYEGNIVLDNVPYSPEPKKYHWSWPLRV